MNSPSPSAATMMASLQTRVRNELAAVNTGATVLLSSAVVEKVYEVFTLTCVMKALTSLGATVYPRDHSSRPTNDMVFRLGPGRIWSPASAPGYILVEYRGRQYELQNGIKVLGKSKIPHELDVCIIGRSAAETSRNTKRDPQQGSIKFLAECKFYGMRIPLEIGREYLGLCDEFSMRIRTIVSNVGDDKVHTLITNHGGTENFEVSPWQRNNLDRFIQWLANELKQVLA